jgi:membrane associated rhomboid family serine protease
MSMGSRDAAPERISEHPALKRSALWVGALVLLLWVIWLVGVWLELDLVRFGVYPRQLSGLLGVMFGPLIHGSAAHLLANTAPLLVLGTALLYGYPRSAWIVLAVLYIGSGLGVWLFARESYHIGISGLIHGLMSFIFVIGILRRDKLAIALSLIVFFLYGSMIWGVFPREPGISFESHMFGALLGVALAFLLRNRDPRPPEKRYSWEDEAEGPAAQAIGSAWKPPGHRGDHEAGSGRRGSGEGSGLRRTGPRSSDSLPGPGPMDAASS